MTDETPDAPHHYKHAKCDKAFLENRFEDACDDCRGLTGDDASLGSVE